MARNKNIHREPKPRVGNPPNSSLAWWKRRWVWSVGAIGALALLLSNLTSILADVRGLPSEYRQTSDQFFEWYGAYDDWKGRWTYFPEGDIAMGSMKLTEEPFQLVIDVSGQGEITGSIETKGICDKIPYFDALMLDGNVKSASRADITIFDYVGGHRTNFAELSLERHEGMIVRPTDDPSGIFAKETRIALAPEGLNDPSEFEPICPNKREEFIKKALGSSKDASAASVPIEQIGPSRIQPTG